MDGSAGNKPPQRQSWAFMADRMPKTVARIKEARQRGDGAHVDACWRRGVVGLEPGWFWAYEAGVAVGVPSAEIVADPVVQQLLRLYPGLSVLMLHDRAADMEAFGGS